MGEDLNYKELGLKVGLEIHQQLDTHKLFCHCPSLLRDDKPDFLVRRFLRASAGETGVIDIAAQHEMLKNIHYEYEGYDDTTCLIELDEEPPLPVNAEAFRIVLQFCKIVNAHVCDVVQFMRKTVVDGSNTSGFQRTALVGYNGLLPEGVRICSVCLEEDACKIVSRSSDKIVYNLSRLGIPLIEIATEPDITTPEQAFCVAKYIGMLLRSTGKVKRGLGTIRQDVNISIAQGERIEIKGAQELRLIPEYVRNEAHRQVNLLVLKQELTARGLSPNYTSNAMDVTSVFSSTQCSWIRKALDDGSGLMAMRFPKFCGLFGFELMPEHRLGTELAGYAKKRGFGGVIHSDEDLLKYSFSANEIETLEHTLGVQKEDGWLMFVGNKKRILAMLDEVLIPRINQLFVGVPKEVRDALPDGRTTYSRPMPGAARMYPETDIPLVYPRLEHVVIPELIDDKIKRFCSKYHLPADIATTLAYAGHSFDDFVNKFSNLKPSFIADVLLSTEKEIKAKGIEYSFNDHEFTLVLDKLNSNEITKDVLLDVFLDIAKGKELDFAGYTSLDSLAVTAIVHDIVVANPGAPVGAIMGKAMAQLRGKADGKLVARIVNEELAKNS